MTPDASSHVLDVFTNVLFEALQFVNIIPTDHINDLNQEIEELKSVVKAFNNIKNNIIDFKNLVAWWNYIKLMVNHKY